MGVWALVFHKIFMDTVVNGNCIIMADVVAIALYWQMLYLGFVKIVSPLCAIVLFGGCKVTMVDVAALCVEEVGGRIAT